MSITPTLTNPLHPDEGKSQMAAMCICIGFPFPAISWECSAPFDGQFDWRTCDGDIAEIVESAQFNSTLLTRQPVPFGSLFRCVCNNSIGIPDSQSAQFIFPSMLFVLSHNACFIEILRKPQSNALMNVFKASQ